MKDAKGRGLFSLRPFAFVPERRWLQCATDVSSMAEQQTMFRPLALAR